MKRFKTYFRVTTIFSTGRSIEAAENRADLSVVFLRDSRDAMVKLANRFDQIVFPENWQVEGGKWERLSHVFQQSLFKLGLELMEEHPDFQKIENYIYFLEKTRKANALYRMKKQVEQAMKED